MVTGKNKEQFEEWLYDNYDSIEVVEEINTIEYFICNNLTAYDIFYSLPFEMKIGVYLAYYDSKDVSINVDFNHTDCGIFYMYSYHSKDNRTYGNSSYIFNTRNEAYKEALKQADELMNK